MDWPMVLFAAVLLASTAYAVGRMHGNRSADARITRETVAAYRSGDHAGWRVGYRMGWLDHMVEMTRQDNRRPAPMWPARAALRAGDGYNGTAYRSRSARQSPPDTCQHRRTDVISPGAVQCIDCGSWLDVDHYGRVGVDPVDVDAEVSAGLDPLDESDAYTSAWYARHPEYRKSPDPVDGNRGHWQEDN